MRFSQGFLHSTAAAAGSSLSITSLGANAASNNSSITIPVGAAVPAGSTILVAATSVSNSFGAITVTDAAGNTYVKDTEINDTVTVLGRLAIFRCSNCNGLSSGQNINISTANASNHQSGLNALAWLVTGITVASPDAAVAKEASPGPASITSGVPATNDEWFLSVINESANYATTFTTNLQSASSNAGTTKGAFFHDTSGTAVTNNANAGTGAYLAVIAGYR